MNIQVLSGAQRLNGIFDGTASMNEQRDASDQNDRKHQRIRGNEENRKRIVEHPL